MKTTKRITPKDLVPSKTYGQVVEWSLQMLECSFYDGELAKQDRRLCPHWQDWLTWGRELYRQEKKASDEYLRDLRKKVPKGFRRVEHSRIETFLKAEETKPKKDTLSAISIMA